VVKFPAPPRRLGSLVHKRPRLRGVSYVSMTCSNSICPSYILVTTLSPAGKVPFSTYLGGSNGVVNAYSIGLNTAGDA
jgi:hypothetical protein